MEFLLVAHIGGTKARFGLKELKGNSSSKNDESNIDEFDNFLYTSRYPIGEFKNSTTMIEQFIQDARDALEYRPKTKTGKNISEEIKPKNIKVCLALAGPLDQNKCDLLNWKLSFDGQLLKDKLGFDGVDLINDFQAVAYGIKVLRESSQDDDFNNFQPLLPPVSTKQKTETKSPKIRAVIGVATGLGKSFLIQPDGEEASEASAYPTEGGHINFAPRDQFQFALLQYILKNIKDDDNQELKRVSIERVVSGRGILTIYRFLQDCQSNPNKEEDDHRTQSKDLDRMKEMLKKVRKEVQEQLKIIKKQEVRETSEEEGQKIAQLIKTWQEEDDQCREPVDPAAVITSAAIRKSDALSIYTIETFVKITAAVVGNCALHFLPDELYLAGGITPQILPFINTDDFRELFSQKDDSRDKLSKIPIYTVHNMEVGLIGAADYAETKMKSQGDSKSIGHGVSLWLESRQGIVTLQQPEKESEDKDKSKPPSPIGVISVGPGLKEVFILKNTPKPYPTDSGYADFGIRSLEEFELVEYIKEDIKEKKEIKENDNIPPVSVERVVSEKGIVQIYHFLKKDYSKPASSKIVQSFKNKIQEDPEFGNIDEIREIDLEFDPKTADEIADAALDKRDPLCMKTMEMFAKAYGSEVGNFALRMLTYEGLFVIGRIPAKILHKETWLRKLFLKEVRNKGRMEKKVIAQIPIYLDPKGDLTGAYNYAENILTNINC